MTPEELKLLGTLSVYTEALASLVAPDVLSNAINAVNAKRAALAQARAEVASQAQVAQNAQPEAPATALVSVPAGIGSTTGTGPKRRGTKR